MQAGHIPETIRNSCFLLRMAVDDHATAQRFARLVHLQSAQRDPTSSSPNPDQCSSPTAMSSSRDNDAPSPPSASIVVLRTSRASQTALNAARTRSLTVPPCATTNAPAEDTRADASPQLHREASVSSCTASAYAECSERRSVAT